MKEDWKGWDVLLKFSLSIIPFVLPVAAWLVVETIQNREFRNLGSRYTKEEHQQYKQETDARLRQMEDKQDAIYDTVSRIDERMKAVQSVLETR